MSVGDLFIQVLLDQPNKLFCGDEAVTGKVAVRWRPSPAMVSQDLFGPLKVSLSFHGRAKSKIWKSNGQTTHIYRGRAPLFAKKWYIHDGPIRILPSETQFFPFTLQFPQQVDQSRSAPGVFDDDLRFNPDQNQRLPPSFDIKYRGFAHHFEAFVAYRIGATASMDKIDVKSAAILEDFEPFIKYGPARMPLTDVERTLRKQFEARRGIRVQNENLVPESARASGFRQKTKALFKSDYYPEYNYAITCKSPRSIYLGQPIMVELRIRPDEKPAAGVVVPEIELGAWAIKITANTQVRAEKSLFSCPESEGNDTVLHYVGPFKSKGPFSKANDFTKTLSTRRITDLPSSFTTFNIRRIYMIKVEYTIIAAGKETKSDYDWPLEILPPLEAEVAMGEPGYVEDDPIAEASSSAPPPMESLDVPPPAYEKVPEAPVSLPV